MLCATFKPRVNVSGGAAARLAAALLVCGLSSLRFAGGEARAESLTAQEIVERSDQVRNPGRPFRQIDTLIEYHDGKPVNQMKLLIYSKADDSNGQYRTLVRFLEPERDREKTILKSGNLMWFYDPASKASVRMSPQQRLMGQAANGDVVTVNFSKDYAATLIGEETISDADRRQRPCWRLEMRANNDTVTYYRIEFWVDRENDFPVKGRFYSDSDRLLKTAFYRRPEEALGRLRPAEVLIIDGVDTRRVTRMNYSDYAYREIPDAWFNRDYLPRFRAD